MDYIEYKNFKEDRSFISACEFFPKIFSLEFTDLSNHLSNYNGYYT